MNEIHPAPGDLYRHYKGGYYRIVCIAQHSETHETLVVYESTAVSRMRQHTERMRAIDLPRSALISTAGTDTLTGVTLVRPAHAFPDRIQHALRHRTYRFDDPPETRAHGSTSNRVEPESKP